jgi:hypothetical protein
MLGFQSTHAMLSIPRKVFRALREKWLLPVHRDIRA